MESLSLFTNVLLFSLAGGVISLLGGILLLRTKTNAERLAHFATPFAAGALLAAAFFDLLPEAIEQTLPGTTGYWILLGIVIFFLLEHFVHWFHHKHDEDHKHSRATAPLVIIGDSVHNLIDGVAIGAAFLINIPAGVITALAVAAHEIPQEIGDFGLLLKYGYRRRSVLLINALSALMSTVGALLTYWLGARVELPIGELIALTVGFFIYIAASDLIPEIHEAGKRREHNYLAALLLIFGIICVGVVTNVTHSAIHSDTSHDETTHYDRHSDDDHHRNDEKVMERMLHCSEIEPQSADCR